MSITLCYWNVRAMGEISRLLLRYSGVSWKDDQVPLDSTGFTRWKAEKYNLGLDLPNLPYLIDGDMKITQSVAIIRYLGRKFGLVPGDNEQDIVKCEMIEQEVTDLRAAFMDICLEVEKFKEMVPGYLENLEKKLGVLDKFVGVGPFVLGEKLTYVDFMVFEFVSQIDKLAPEQVAKATNIGRLLQHFQDLPQLREWFSSDEFKKGIPVNDFSPTFCCEHWLGLAEEFQL